MKLWTIQSVQRWERLRQHGVLRARRFDSEFYCKTVYDWMRRELTRRVGASPASGVFPLWAWYQWSSIDRRRPDLRCSGHANRGTRAVRLEIELADERVLLSDFSLWHFPLNCSPVPESEEDLDRFDEELRAFGYRPPLGWEEFDKAMQHPDLAARVEKSWERIFDLDWCREGIADPRDRKQIQAVFWELHLQDVCRADHFTAR
jgi:hypothetical protein